MDDLDELLNATMAALDSFGFNRAAETVARASTEIERLRAEVAALRADAERYRWLRDDATTQRLEDFLEITAPEWDAEIDAARAAQGDN